MRKFPETTAAAPADPTIPQDFQFDNAIWNQIGISFNDLGSATIVAATPAGGWNRYNVNTTLNTAVRQPAGGFAYYIVGNYTPALATTWSQADVNTLVIQNPANVAQTVMPPAAAIVTNAARGATDTIAHEFGHMLSNQFQWRLNERYNGHLPAIPNPNNYHSNTATDLMYPTVQNPAIGQVFPAGAADEIRNNIGRRDDVNTIRSPFISAAYTNSDKGAAPGVNLVHNIVQSQTSAAVGSSALFRVEVNNIPWSNQTSIALGGVDPNNLTNNWRVDQSARRIANMKEEISFFYSSSGTTPLTAADPLYLGFGNVTSVDKSYALFDPSTVKVEVWSDILAAGAPGTGTVLAAADYNLMTSFDAVLGKFNFGSVEFPAGKLTGIRDIQIRFNLMVVPEPSSLVLVGLGPTIIFGLFARRENQTRNRKWALTPTGTAQALHCPLHRTGLPITTVIL